MQKKPKVTDRSRLRHPYPNGNPVECPICHEKFELKRISETTGSFECLKCKKTFRVKKQK